MPFSRKELAILVVITLVAAFLRLYRLDDLPPGLSGDTAYKGIAASRILHGERPIFFAESWGGIEPMYMYIVAAFFRFLGMAPLVLKTVSAVIGVVTVPLLYVAAREMFSSSTIGLLSSAWLAISYWHVSWSRLGWESILVPLFITGTFYLLWRGLKSGRWIFFVCAGLSLGASLYTYQAMRFLPILIILYLGYRSLVDRGFWRAYRLKMVLLLVISLAVFLPLGGYFATHPGTFLGRAGEVSIFNPEKNPEGPLRSLLASAINILGTYNVQGDPFWRHNLPGRPVFDVLSSACFFLGLGVSVVRFRKGAYSLVLVWLIVMSLPPILTPPRDVPHFTRSIGALPAACILPAIGVQGAWEWLTATGPSMRVRRLCWLSVSAVLVSAALFTYQDYFVAWAGNKDLRDHYFDGQFLDVATAMNQLDDPDGVWILPISALASPHDETGHHTIEFMYRGVAPFHFLNLDEATAAQELSRLSRGRSRAMVVDYKNYTLENAYNYIDADPKRLLPFLLSKCGQQVSKSDFEGFNVLVYELPDRPVFTIAESFRPVSVNFGGQIVLTGVAYGTCTEQCGCAGTGTEQGTLPSGSEAWVVLRWQTLTELSADYKVAVYLLDQRERSAGQVDKLLLSNHLHLTSDWDQGQVEIDYYTLPSLPATAPGDYHIAVAVYDPETMQRLAVLDKAGNQVGHSYELGAVQIIPPLVPPSVQPMRMVPGDTLVPEVRLLGYDLPREEVTPGEAVEVALYWQALADVDNDYVVVLTVRDDKAQVWGQEESRPAYGAYPTTEWEQDEIVRDWHDLPIASEVPEGEYHLYVGIEEEGILTKELDLATVRVHGRTRTYEVPKMEHELAWSLGEGVELLGYDVGDTVEPGKRLTLILYWRCLRPMDESYTVFTHLLDQENAIRGQLDSTPVQGEAPTTSWLQGEVVRDQYEIAVDPHAPEGEYTIEVGMYDANTMSRLPVRDARGEGQGDRVLLEKVQVLR